MMKKMVFWALVCTVALCSSSAVYGQATGSFSGTVVDKSGSFIVGATVTAISQGTGASRQAKTDESGHYLIPLLPVSIYTVRVEFQGFKTVESKDLRLQVDEARELDFTLSPSTQSTEVEVSASAVAVETANPSLGQVITAEEVAQLPLNGRDFVQLATLTPGTTQETSAGSFFNGAPSSEVSARGSYSLSVGGSRPNSTDWLIDGTDNNELTAGGIGILSSIDDIQEFKVLTYNYSAEYGTRGGPTVLVTTKSGTNNFHGSLFEFFRNTNLDAKSFFAAKPEQFNLNQFGGSIGGPIQNNKTFFFVDGEQKYQRHGIPFTGLIPTDAMRNGDFSNDPFGNALAPGAIINPYVTGSPAGTNFQCDAQGNPMPLNGATPANPAGNGSQPAGTPCNKIPAGLINPIAKQLVALYPEPNANNQSLNLNFQSEPVRKLDETKFDIRLDRTFSSADTAFARFSYDQAVSYIPGGGGVSNFTESNFFASNQGIINHARNVSISETHVFSPTAVNQVSAGYNRIFDYITSQGSGTCAAAKLGIPGANLDCGSGSCPSGAVSCGLTISQVLGGFFSVGDRGFSPFQGGTDIYSISDTVNLIRGKHDIRVGGSYRANEMNTKTEGFQDGFWTFSGAWTFNPVADLLTGLTSLAIHDQTFKGPTTGRRWQIIRPYIQDDWRVTNDITLNLGLAWNVTTPEYETANRWANFNPATKKLDISGQGADKYAGIHYDLTDFEPRIGIAWKPWGSEKTAIRAGYAIYHDSSWNQGAQGLWQNPPYYAESDLFAFGGGCTFATAACATMFGKTPGAISISNGFQIFTTPPNLSTFTGTVFSQNDDFRLGRIQQFNFNIERQLPGQVVLTVGYAGSRAAHILLYGNNENVNAPAACAGDGPKSVPGYTLGCGPGGAFFVSPFAAALPNFNTVTAIIDQGRAHYNSLQIKAETKSSRHGLYALIGYTYSRSYDNGYPDGLGSNVGATYFPLPNYHKLDWALSQTNLDSNFVASVIYDLPFGKGKRFGSNWSTPVNTLLGGWQLTVIERITSGFPIFIVDTNNPSGSNFLNNNGTDLGRPNQVGDPNKGGPVAANPGCVAPAQVHTLTNWYNPCAFVTPPAGELGNANRAPLNGPDFVNTDFSVIKQFALPWENMGLNFRAEFFNLANHSQFATPAANSSLLIPDTNATGSQTISSTVNNPRVVQFALKLTF